MAVSGEERSNGGFRQLLAPVAIAADKEDVDALDIKGFRSASFMVTVGAHDNAHIPDNTKHLQIRLEHSNDNVNFTPCSDDEVLGSLPGLLASGTFAEIKAAPDVNTAFMAAYIGDKDYVKPVIKVTGNLGNGVIVGISALLQDPKYRPLQ